MEKGFTIPVLDHGFVRYIDSMGTDERIVEAARISYKSPSKGEDQDKKLLKYLWKNKHTSPFEMVKLTLNIKMPIFVMRQYVRHRMQNLNEVSARYTELPEEFYIPEKWRAQDVKNKQGSISVDEFDEKYMHLNSGAFMPSNSDFELTKNEMFSLGMQKYCKSSYTFYKELLAMGMAREMARMVLPVNIYTEIYACWDLKNLFHFITLREDAHAQAEIQSYGKAIKAICKELFPWTTEAYENFKWKMVDINEEPDGARERGDA